MAQKKGKLTDNVSTALDLTSFLEPRHKATGISINFFASRCHLERNRAVNENLLIDLQFPYSKNLTLITYQL